MQVIYWSYTCDLFISELVLIVLKMIILLYVFIKCSKNVKSNIEQVLVTTPLKTPTIRPLTSHHKKTIQARKLYNLDEPDTQDTAGEVMYSCGPQHMAKQKQDDQLEPTYSSYVRIPDVTLKTCQKR